MTEKIKEKRLVFNKDGMLKGSLDTLDHSMGVFDMMKINYEDEEGKNLVLDELEKLVDQSREYLASLTFPEKMKAYGHTFESLANTYEISTNQVCEYARRLRLIQAWLDIRDGPAYCTCSAMVWDQEYEGNVVPYLYCVIKGGMSRIKEVGEIDRGCATCEHTPCEHIWDPEHDSEHCRDYMRRKSEKYPITPCIYVNPSDVDIDIALELHRLNEGPEGY